MREAVIFLIFTQFATSVHADLAEETIAKWRAKDKALKTLDIALRIDRDLNEQKEVTVCLSLDHRSALIFSSHVAIQHATKDSVESIESATDRVARPLRMIALDGKRDSRPRPLRRFHNFSRQRKERILVTDIAYILKVENLLFDINGNAQGFVANAQMVQKYLVRHS